MKLKKLTLVIFLFLVAAVAIWLYMNTHICPPRQVYAGGGCKGTGLIMGPE